MGKSRNNQILNLVVLSFQDVFLTFQAESVFLIIFFGIIVSCTKNQRKCHYYIKIYKIF